MLKLTSLETHPQFKFGCNQLTEQKAKVLVNTGEYRG